MQIFIDSADAKQIEIWLAQGVVDGATTNPSIMFKDGVTYVSIFAGRVADEGNDPAMVIRNVRNWLDQWESPARIIVGSIRTVMDIQSAALAGAHIITIPPQFLPKMVDHRYSRETVRQFVRDAEKTLKEMSKVKVQVAAPGAG